MSADFLPKYSNDRPHHYFFGVAIYPATSGEKAGQFYLKYGPIYVNNEMIDKVCNAVIRMTDEVFKQTSYEAMKIEGCYELGITLSSMKMSCEINQCSLHHISSAEEFDDSSIEMFVELANTSKEMRKKLLESKIGGK